MQARGGGGKAKEIAEGVIDQLGRRTHPQFGDLLDQPDDEDTTNGT